MNPIAIPVAILSLSGIVMIVRNAGTAISKRFHSILPRLDTIRIPTMISAGAVTSDVITSNNGEKKSAKRNNTPVTTDAKPVLAPAATPRMTQHRMLLSMFRIQHPLQLQVNQKGALFLHVVIFLLSLNLLDLQLQLVCLLYRRNLQTRM